MIELEDFTLEIHKRDRRTKSGSLLVGKYDYQQKHLQWMQEEIRDLQSGLYPPSKYRIELIKTYVLRENKMTGKQFRERYDTPYTCSPSSETYWSA